MQLESFLELSARQTPDKTAVVCGSSRITFCQLNRQANCLAHALIDRGLQRGDRVALFLDNSIEACLAVFAVLKAGGVFLPINPTTKADKLAFLLNNSRAAALVMRSCSESLVAGLPPTHALRHVITIDESVAADLRPAARVDCLSGLLSEFSHATTEPAKRSIDLDLAALIYTSGSTGHAKGVMLSHLNMTTAARSITTYLENRSDDIILNALPMSFDYGLYQLLMAMRVGATLVLENGFTFADPVLQTIAREKVTGFPIVPTMAAMLLRLDLSAYDLSSVRYLTNTAAALSIEHISGLRRLFPQARLYSMYGLTECKRVSYLPPEQIDVRPGSVGRGMPNQETWIVDEFGQPVGPGTVGELVVRGAHVMQGYWENEAATTRRLKPGRMPGERVLHTGDLFKADEQGYLYFVGRRDDIIKTRGEKVAPREVEQALSKHPDVHEVIVFGVPDKLLGSAIHACVTVREKSLITPQELRRYCAGAMEDFCVPRVIRTVDAIPRTRNGKFDKQALIDAALPGGRESRVPGRPHLRPAPTPASVQ